MSKRNSLLFKNVFLPFTQKAKKKGSRMTSFDKFLFLKNFFIYPGKKPNQKKKRLLQRKLDRQRRANNPQNY